MWREKKKLLTCLLLSYVFFHIYIFTPRYFERGKEREKTSIFQFVANLFALAFMPSNSFYVECVLHKIGVFRLLFCLRNEYKNGIEAGAKAIKRGRTPKRDLINILCGFQVYCCQLKYGFPRNDFPSEILPAFKIQKCADFSRSFDIPIKNHNKIHEI